MSPVIAVIADELVHQPLQVAFIENDHMVEQIATACANPTLGHTILPWTAEAGALGLDIETLDCGDNLIVEIHAAIEDLIFRCGVVGEGFAQLLAHPCARCMPGHVVVKNLPPVMRDDEEAVENAEGERR